MRWLIGGILGFWLMAIGVSMAWPGEEGSRLLVQAPVLGDQGEPLANDPEPETDGGPRAVEGEPLVVRPPCRFQWDAVTTCLRVEPGQPDKIEPCTPEGYRLYVRQVPDPYPMMPSGSVDHPATSLGCEEVPLVDQTLYRAVATAVGGEPVGESRHSEDIHFLFLAQAVPPPVDTVPPAEITTLSVKNQ